MDSSKHQLNMNSESDDFLREFFNFVQQHKEADARQTVTTHCNVIPTENIPTEIPSEIVPIIPTDIMTTESTSALNTTPTLEKPVALDITATSSGTSYFIEDPSLIRSDMAKMSGFSINASNNITDGVLTEPVISIVSHALDPYIVDTKTGSINDNFVPFYNEGQDDINERVSAELEKVLNDPAAFEDIELCLECSEDDIEAIQEDTFKRNQFQSGSFSLHAGNSNIQSETHLKISFPSIQDDYNITSSKRCASCKLPFSTDTDLLNHLDVCACEVLICKDCVYNTKSVKRFITHMEKRHKCFQIHRLLYNFTNSYRKLQDSEAEPDDQESIQSAVQNISETQTKEAVSDKVNRDDGTTASGSIESSFSEPEARYHCNICNYVGRSRKLLKMHQEKHNPKRKQYDCQICDFSCVQKRTFDGHMNSHKDLYLFHCSKCQKQFTTVSALNRHSKTHRTERLYNCNICLKSFKIKGTYTDHMKKVHEVCAPDRRENSNIGTPHEDSDISKRPQLEMMATQTNSLRDIENAHNGENKNSAVIKLCSSFEKKSKEYKNATEDSIELDFQSQDCVSRKPTRDEGTQTKTDKHFLCTWPGCEKSFRDNYNLNSHYSRHTLSKRFSCSECDFRCIQKGNLAYHERTKHAKKIVSKAKLSKLRNDDETI